MTPEQRLRFDIDRVDSFRLAVSTCGDYSIFENEISTDVWEYANRTLPNLIASGKVFDIRMRLGQISVDDLAFPDDGIDFDVAEDLAADSITAALKVFSKPVLNNWNGRHENPAVLGTYFVNLCSMTFPGPFRKWQRDTQRLDYLGINPCLLYTSPSPRDRTRSRMPSSA